MASKEASKKETRKRNWVFVVYPDSAPEGWMDILAEQHVCAFVSPLHDRDANADGEPKKPHWHVMLMFKGLKTEEQAQEISDLFSHVKVQPCKDTRAYARYLCHLDNPEKSQYSVGDVQSYGGADYLEMVGSAADVDSALAEMMDWCIEQRCTSFFKLSNFARFNRPDWFRVLTASRTVYLTAWLRSFQWELDRGYPADGDKGEHYDTPPCDH